MVVADRYHGAEAAAIQDLGRPDGQSVLTTGQPQASASIKTLGKPSNVDDSTNTAARAMWANGLATKPAKLTSSARSSCLDSARSLRAYSA
jgi:hypothetical protein